MKDTQSKIAPGGANVDFHTHSNHSTDGSKSIKQLLKMAHKDNTVMLGVTDHNTISGVNSYLDKIHVARETVLEPVNGKTTLFPGVEITARVGSVKNIKGRPSKIHLVAYGIDRNDDSPISQLLKLKHLNDRHVDLGFLNQLQKEFDLYIDDFTILQYYIYKQKQNHEVQAFGKQETIDFINYIGYDIASDENELREIINKYETIDRLDLEAKDVIDLVHASGGIVLLAHPHLNLRRTNYPKEVVNYLIENEIDGFELFYPRSIKESEIFLKKVSRENNIKLFSAGSDYHGEHSYDQGYGEFKPVTTNKVQAFIDYMQDMNYARKRGSLIIKNYKHLHDNNINELLEKYRSKYCAYEHINKATPISEIPEY